MIAGLWLSASACVKNDTYDCENVIAYSVWGATPEDRWGFNTSPPVEGVEFAQPNMSFEVAADAQVKVDSVGGVLVIVRPLEAPKELRYQISFEILMPLEPLPVNIAARAEDAAVRIPTSPSLPATKVCDVPLVGVEFSLLEASGVSTLPLPEGFRRLYRGVIPALETDCVTASGFQFEFELTNVHLRPPRTLDKCEW